MYFVFNTDFLPKPCKSMFLSSAAGFVIPYENLGHWQLLQWNTSKHWNRSDIVNKKIKC